MIITLLSSILTNSTLLLLIIFKSDRLFGDFRYVLFIYTSYCIFYASVQFIVQPIIHTFGPIFVLIVNGPFTFSKPIGELMLGIYCATYALCITFLVAQFRYRYIATIQIQRELLSYLQIFRIFIPCLFISLIWFSICYFGFHGNYNMKKMMLRNDVMQKYKINLENTSFIGPCYYTIDENGLRDYRLLEVIFGEGLVMIIIGCFSMISFFSISIRIQQNATKYSFSERKAQINNQIFLTMNLQAILPFFLMYIPVLFVVTAPLFDIDYSYFSNLTALSASVYPAIEPVIAIVLIREYREVFVCKTKVRINTVHLDNAT
ncbi:unnamed protein product [Caenorhabditis angaria]|uniref:Seven TM Receptor n=1 Tax=Caenorhabditis angaria TaxID=860376 RepID=A0A9P1N1Q2_9PELO|nr:unnamed protein product [Caenorhabditis angaria]